MLAVYITHSRRSINTYCSTMVCRRPALWSSPRNHHIEDTASPASNVTRWHDRIKMLRGSRCETRGALDLTALPPLRNMPVVSRFKSYISQFTCNLRNSSEKALTWEGMVPSVGMDPCVYCTWGVCNLTVNSGMRTGHIRGPSARR